MRRHAGAKPEGFAGQQPRAQSAVFVQRQCRGVVVRERGVGLLVLVGQRHPGLNAVQCAALGARLFETFGMRDAAAGDHPVHFFGLDSLDNAHAVTMHDFARKQIGDGGEADVRMRPDIDGLRKPGREVLGADVIEEDERPDHVPACERQYPSDFEPAEIPPPLVDDIHAIWFTRPAGAGARRGSPRFPAKGSVVMRLTPFRNGAAPYKDFRYSARSFFSPEERPNEKCES